MAKNEHARDHAGDAEKQRRADELCFGNAMASFGRQIFVDAHLYEGQQIDGYGDVDQLHFSTSCIASLTASSAVCATWMPGSATPSRCTSHVSRPMTGMPKRKAKATSERVP